jgi:hypothetical protein
LIARCVRRAFLCGVDPYTRQDSSHRKEWILDRMREFVHNYIHATGHGLGILVNFGHYPKVEYERIVL